MNIDLRLDAHFIDYCFILVYFLVVLGVGVLSRRTVKNSTDFFLSGRRLPAWICGLAFISANIGAVELIGQAANGAQYGMPSIHYYWIGGIPAMVFLGLIMMPFYYASRVRSVPEYLRLRFNKPTHLFQSIAFAVATALTAGINLYALAILVNVLIGWPIWVSIVAAAAIVLIYTGLGGLQAAIYNEVLQFFIVVAAMVPVTIAGLKRVGGWNGLTAKIGSDPRLGSQALHAWAGSGSLTNPTNPFGSWFVIVMGIGFVMSFGYWTTNFTEVQRALSAKDMSNAQRTPIIAAIAKMLLPIIVILPGMIVGQLVPQIGTEHMPYNEALPALINEVLPNGLLGLALAGLLAAFMAGMAANVSAFNTVVTYDIIQTYVLKDRPDSFYLQWGRKVNAIGVLVGVATAFIAASYNNLQDYIQQLQSYFNAPLFATFILGLFWKRMSPWAGFWGLISGVLGAAGTTLSVKLGWVTFNSNQMGAFVSATVAFIVDIVVSIIVTRFTRPKPLEELDGLVWGRSKLPVRGAMPAPDLSAPVAPEPVAAATTASADGDVAVMVEAPATPTVTIHWWNKPLPLGMVVLAACLVLNIVFA